MEINDRIALLKKHLKLSNTEFSERINVQPSTLSHIFSGRNRPSIDFILKIKKAFPDISLNWILLGEGTIENNHKKPSSFVSEGLFSIAASQPQNHDELEKIVFFYKNGTFKIYNA